MKMKKIELTEKDFDGINDLSFRQAAKKFNITPAAAKSMVGDYNKNGFSDNLNFYVNTPQNMAAFNKGDFSIG
ncbi:MAG: hypothetical protein ACFWTQ_03210 [Lactococcus sp.]|jgi:transposase